MNIKRNGPHPAFSKLSKSQIETSPPALACWTTFADKYICGYFRAKLEVIIVNTGILDLFTGLLFKCNTKLTRKLTYENLIYTLTHKIDESFTRASLQR